MPAPNQDLVAHIVYPGEKLRAVFKGTKTRAKSLCGVMVSKRPSAAAPVCRNCFTAYHRLDVDQAAEMGSPTQP